MRLSLADLVLAARTPLGFINGKPVYPIMGGAESDDDQEDDKDKKKSEDDQEDDDSDDDPNGLRIKELSDEAARRRVENKQLKRALEEAQGRLKEIDDQGRSETERLTLQVSELEAKNAALVQSNQDLSIKNAFLADKTHSWRNPDTAMKLVDLNSVEIDDDGRIRGLDKAIKSLAESDSYLLNPSDEDTGLPKPAPQSTGDKPGGGRKKDKLELNREHLVSKYNLHSHVAP